MLGSSTVAAPHVGVQSNIATENIAPEASTSVPLDVAGAVPTCGRVPLPYPWYQSTCL